MIKRTLYIGNPAYLKLKNQQMLVQEPKTKTVLGTIPVEDMALLMLDHPQITISNQLLVKLQGNTIAIITCDKHHLPYGLMLPMHGHTEYSERIKKQISVSEPLKKQLWKQTIEQKIKNQLAVLKLFNKHTKVLETYSQNVKSGDSTNREGMAAQYYWNELFTNFSRSRYGDTPNNLLNFGYAVLRSIVARALINSGLLPVLGIHHKNKYNPYCLADDIMEPYRPFVDKLVYNYIRLHGRPDQLTKTAKASILKLATLDVYIDTKTRPLLIAVTTTTASLYKCYTGVSRALKYPELD